MNGLPENSIQKGRLFELVVLKRLGDDAIDVSGDIFSGPFDGICPKGQIYDAKSSSLNRFGFWRFSLDKIVDFYYLGAFDKDYIRLLHVWRIPGDFECDYISIYEDTYNKHSGRTYKHSIEDMREYEFTGKFIDKFNESVLIDLLVSNKDNQ